MPDAIALRASPRPDLLVFEISAKLTEDDIAWMANLVRSAFDACSEIDLLLLMTHFDGAELSALSNPTAMKAMIESNKHVRRYGVVGAPAWARTMIAVFDVVSPVNAKTFDISDEDAAWTWINNASSSL